MRTLASVLIPIALLSSCGSTRRDVRGQPEVKTMLSVENRNFNDMRVYVQHESTQQVIMGTVSAFTTRDFKIPDNLLFGTTVLRFVAVSIVDSGGFLGGSGGESLLFYPVSIGYCTLQS